MRARLASRRKNTGTALASLLPIAKYVSFLALPRSVAAIGIAPTGIGDQTNDNARNG